ncbi:MAG: crossover junction endodeoxyribonuclease RuvC [Candidatus Cloacimonadota bacterium]|nr:crossover junction endodeoxyribonuclease RuvC [Candidatus Cloacimonadota bacterium]
MNKQKPLILGIDPGTTATGYAFLQIENRKVIPIDYGVIKVSRNLNLQARIEKIYERISELIKLYKPDQAGIEKIFHAKNVRSILSLGEARGVILLALQQQKIPTYEYSPREIKKAVVGNGNASKQQVQFMVNAILKIKVPENSYDVSDALAIALCHHHKLNAKI